MGARYSIMRGATGFSSEVVEGGNKQVLFQAEYFVPIIQQANIRALLFYDTGRVYSLRKPLSLTTS